MNIIVRYRALLLTTAAWFSIVLFAAFSTVRAGAPQQAAPQQEEKTPVQEQSQETADAKSAGCLTCHTSVDSKSMHAESTVRIGCVDCHGGNAQISIAAGTAPDSASYREAKRKAHVLSRNILNDDRSANPLRAYTKWLRETPEYIQFVNPGDLRVADRTCGQAGCHVGEVNRTRKSMMATGAMLWQAALYNNGAFPFKNAHYGESYNRDGIAQRIETWPPPTPEDTKKKSILPFLEPLPRWETSEPGNVLRVFERGGTKKGETGNPEPEEDNGKPDVKLSNRGFGTLLRTDPVFLGLQKTRLLDPLLYFPGTNDQPGDYRGSGCTACHVIYANDRDPVHSGHYAQYGNEGHSFQSDPTIPKNEPGHPIAHLLTKSIPTSQCMTCHVHPGTNMVITYLGYLWWDNEVDGDKMYPKKQHDPSEEERAKVADRNPEAAAARGMWSDVEFLKKLGTPEFNNKLEHTQFADFHSHGWIYRAVFKHDRKGNLLDENGDIVSPTDPEKFKKAVHLKDIHLEKGMHCVDCHFDQDAHGNGKLYGETRNAVEIGCIDCHGSATEYSKLVTSSFAAPEGGSSLKRLRTPWKQARFYWKENKLYQRSEVEPNVEWEVVQTKDSITPGNMHYSEKSRLAKTMLKDGSTWGEMPADQAQLAHSDSRMTCATCHSSWAPSCFGCHLNMRANQRKPMLHTEGLMTRNWTAYNFMVLRDDTYMLGIDGTATGNKISPVRSACAVVVSSQNADRDWIYYDQQTISAEGYSGQAFSPFVPHTVRAKETKTCTDCHVSREKDNNAWMAQVMIQGTNFLNFLGRWAWVAQGKHGFEAVAIAERDEPQAVYGSDLHKNAYPANFKKFEKHELELPEAYEHAGEILDIQMRGEYVYTANGPQGMRVYDISNIENKDFSERITTAPVSPLGQQLYVKTKYAMAIASPTTLGVDPTRNRNPDNEEQPISLITGFLYVADKYEGLVIIGDLPGDKKWPAGVSTLLDGDPKNNFLHRALAFNPNGALNGAHRIIIVGNYAYMLCDAGLQVIDLSNVLKPQITATIGAPFLNQPTGVQVQFRYAFVTDHDGLKVLDATQLAQPRPVEGAVAPLKDARNLNVSRTYAYVADGSDGIAVVDVERPEHPKLDFLYNANGELNDTNDIKVGMVSSGQYAEVADGKNGFKIVQLFSPDTTPNYIGFSPRPVPKLIARFKTKGHAIALSKGVDRDRAVDESGNQMAVFGRRGSRPFNLEEMQRMYLRNGELFTVTDKPPGPPTSGVVTGTGAAPTGNQ